MKLNVITLALAAAVFGVVSAQAQTVIVKEKSPDVVVKERVVTPGVTVTTGSGVSDCKTKSVTKVDGDGDRTQIEKTKCD